MTLQEQIAALPEWPDAAGFYAPECWDAEIATAALARLALAREWIADAHRVGCMKLTSNFYVCDCGRDALLAALEPK